MSGETGETKRISGDIALTLKYAARSRRYGPKLAESSGSRVSVDSEVRVRCVK